MIRYLIALTLVVSTTSLRAQPAGAQAEVLFREGRDLLAAGKVAEACTAFEQSQKLEAAVTTLLNLAGCREKNGQLATAWGLFLDVERQTRSGPDDATLKLHDIAQSRAKKLEPRVSKLTISVPAESHVDGLEISRGGEKLEPAMWNRALPVDGGTFTITAHAPGTAPWSTQVTVGPAADIKTVDIPKLGSVVPRPTETKPPATKPPQTAATKPQAAPPPAPPKPRPTPPAPPEPTPPPKPAPPPPKVASVDVAEPVDEPVRSTHSTLVVPLAVGGGAVVLGGVALGLELSSSSTYSEAKAEMTNQARRTSLYNSANMKYQLAQGFGIAGLACAGAAVWLYLRGRHADDHATSMTVMVSPTGVGFAGGF